MKISDLFNSITDTVALKYPISTTTSFLASINWHLWELLFFQICVLIIDIVRQKYIKKERQKDLNETRKEVTEMAEKTTQKENMK
ncbi:hypothetical protein [Chryseobacterium defluvii]|uniref:Uncharacterized protein n=1 Tax=Chryseobacterium defluvii TaxID=160396 RepID=A0A495SF35_9FLAO|nr:hypothetical protein [Chryseobacterium defluvii]RKS98229.1 hypothetical protein BCF58_2370 [Chryseobacterium defluvii]